ncbi:hypothetical protein [Ferrimicrobium sp.]|uniref:hypothetical protein n=1 Tax=Ferrimicrobium sp. TaxID=2926050 RepID=UPI00260E1CF3|nr:hypothetical protein [Ferrimicrobium sp.]
MPKRYRYHDYDPALDTTTQADEILDALADSLTYHGNVSEALRELLAQGFGATPGLAELLERLRRRRDELLAHYDPNGLVAQLNTELDAIISQEHTTRSEAYAATGDEQHLLSGLELDALPAGLGDRIRELTNYEFLDERAKERFGDLVESLRSSILREQVQQLRDALTTADPEMTAQMMNELAELIERFRNGDDVEADFTNFKQQYPGIAGDDEGFEDFLARLVESARLTQSLLGSMDAATRAELMDLMSALSESPQLGQAMSRLGSALGSWTNADAAGYGFHGEVPLGLGELEEVMSTLGQLDELEGALKQASSPERLSELDSAQLEELLGSDAADAVSRLKQLADQLSDAGLINRDGGKLELTGNAINKLGDIILHRLFPAGQARLLGNHESRRIGHQGTDLSGETKPYEFGDPFRLALRDTLTNALSRQGGGTPLQLAPEDFTVELTEERTRAATMLALDLSLSMPLNDTFLPAKQVALALSNLIHSRYPRDYLGYVVFSEVAREVDLAHLPSAQWDYVYGTNIEHALLLCRARLRHQPGYRQILLVTDGEPTAHIDPDSHEVFFAYPPSPETIQRTLAEVLRCTREGITINLFILNPDTGLRSFVNDVLAINHGQAFYSSGTTLGSTLVQEYVDDRVKRASRRPSA